MDHPRPLDEPVTGERASEQARGIAAGRDEQRGGAASAIAGQAVASGLNFVFTLLVARSLAPEAFGAFTLFFSALMLAALVHGSLIGVPMTIGSVRVQDVFRHAVVVHVPTMVTLGAAYAAAAWGIARFGLRATWLAGGLVVAVFLTSELLRRAMMAAGKWGALAASDALGLSARVLGAVAIGRAEDPLLTSILLVGAGAGLSAVVAALLSRGMIAEAFARGRDGARRLSLRAGTIQLVGQMASWGNSQALLYVLSGRGGNAQVGATNATQQLVAPLNVLLTGAGNWALPALVRYAATLPPAERRRGVLAWSLRFGGLLALACAAYGLLALAFAHPVMDVVFARRYEADLGLVVWWTASLCAAALARGVTAGLTVIGRARSVAVGYIVALPVVVAAAIVLEVRPVALVPVGSTIGSVIAGAWMAAAMMRTRVGERAA